MLREMKNFKFYFTVIILLLFTAIAFTQEVDMERKESKQHSTDNALGGSSMSSHNVRDYMYLDNVKLPRTFASDLTQLGFQIIFPMCNQS